MKKNIIANFFGRFWSSLSSFLFIPIYIHYLGFESYSIISFTVVIAGLMSIFDAGFTATLSREVARTDNTQKEKIRIFQTLESSYIIISLAVIVSILLLSNYISHVWLNLKEYKPEEVGRFLRIISLDIGFQMIFKFYLGGLMGNEQQVRANIIQIAWGICRNGLVIILIVFLPRLDTFFLWQSISTVLFTVVIRFSFASMFKNFNIYFPTIKFEKSVFNEIWRFAGGMVLISIVAALNTQLDKLIISKFLPIEELGYYTLAVSISTALIIIARPFSLAVLPRFTALYSSSNEHEALLLFTKVNKVISILIFSIMSSMIFFSKEIVWAWTGDSELASKSCSFLPIIAISYTMLALTVIPFNIAIAKGYTRLNNIMGITSLIITIPGYWAATHFYGAIGTAWVFCIVQVLNTFIYIYIIQQKFLERTSMLMLYGKRIILPIVTALLIAYFFSYFKYLFISRLMIISYVGLSCFITFFVLGIIYFYKDLKGNFLVRKSNFRQIKNI